MTSPMPSQPKNAASEQHLSPVTAHVEALAKIIWLAGFERAFDRTPSDPWENQNDAVKDTHRDTARKVLAAGYGRPAQLPASPGNADELRKQAFELTPSEQYRLAFVIAENVGYVLTEEQEHPDSPHSRPAQTAMTAKGALEIAANIAESIDSGRGNEKEIARAIREVARRGYWDRLSLPSAPSAPGGQGAPYGIIDPDYARVFTIARTLAWQEGYALLFHGSFTRDLDLIAVPWTAAACEPEHLLQRVASAAELKILVGDDGKKHHGRKAWTLTFKTFGDPRFIDFSIMPKCSAVTSTERASPTASSPADSALSQRLPE